MVWKKYTEEDLERLTKQNKEEKRYGRGRGKAVRIVGTNTVFPTISACADHFHVSSTTISNILSGKNPHGSIALEYVERPV